METLSIVLQLILSLSILVTLHECGHFFPAKWFKTRVEKFYLFFNPYFELFKIQKGETEYGIGWIPFGGYVKISGMIDESMDTEQMKQPMQPWEFRAKPAWQRLIIMVGGVTVNFILGFLIFAGILWYYGESYVNTADVDKGIAVYELGEQIGLQDGDKVLSVGDYPMTKFNPGMVTQEIILKSPSTMTVERNGSEVQLSIPDNMAELLTKHENKGRPLYDYLIPQKATSIKADGPADKMGLKEGDKFLAIDGVAVSYNHEMQLNLAGKAEKEVQFSVLRNGTDTLAMSTTLTKKGKLGIGNVGIVSIASMFDSCWDWHRFWQITAMLSILLGFFNLLPIPALDGGYVMFLLWEVITGKKVSDKVMEYATTVGFFILIALMIFALGLDFSRLF